MANVDIIKCVALFYKLGAAPKDFIRNEKISHKAASFLVLLLVLLQLVISILSNLCVWKQPIRHQRLFVRWLLNAQL